MPKIIIDTDPGIDDAQAIAFAVAHKDIELIGLSTVFGNADIDTTTQNALVVLEQFGCTNIPVAKGAASPLVIERYPAPDFVHGKDGMGNLNLPGASEAPLAETAAEFIVRCASENPGQITVVAIGPLTNIALALQLDPELPDKLNGLVVMGGTVDEPGNVSPVAEANFINDPHAADIVCGEDWPLTIIGLDVTMKTALTDSLFLKLKNDAGKIGEFLWHSSRFYVDFYSNLSQAISDERACAMHDASALVYAVQPELFTIVSSPARVADGGIAMGQLVLDRGCEPYLLPHWNDRPNVNVAMQVNDKAVLSAFVDTIIGR
jgi:inosine-uridine nucleoside N-ribohydrolase